MTLTFVPIPGDPLGATGDPDTCKADLVLCPGCSNHEDCKAKALVRRKPVSEEKKVEIRQTQAAFSLMTQDSGADTSPLIGLILEKKEEE